MFVFGEASAERLQKYEDSRWWLLSAGASVKTLQRYAVWSLWLLCDEALGERLQQLKGTARVSKAGLAVEKSGRGAFSTWAAFMLIKLWPDRPRTNVLGAVTEPQVARGSAEVRDSLLP